MRIKVQRFFFGDKYTIGRLYIDEVYQCDTLEDPVRDGPKIPGETAIPAGRYRVSLGFSPHFKRYLPLLHDVPGFTGILIHAGNTPKDTRGCIIPGENKVKGQVVNSRYWEMIITEDVRYAEDIEDNIRILIVNIK